MHTEEGSETAERAGRLRILDLFNSEKRRMRGCLIAFYSIPRRGSEGGGAGLFFPGIP